MTLDNGKDATPSSALRQAILSVLIATPGQIKARKTLQDMFWSAADPERASANLRTALYLLRQDLKVLGKDVVRSDRHAVSLAPERIVVVPDNARGQSFLEGMDLALEDCEPFEDWLRAMRTEEDKPDRDFSDRSPRTLRRAEPAHLGLGLLPPITSALSQGDLIRAESVVDSIARFVAQTTELNVHDLRGYDAPAVPFPIETGTGPTHLAQALVERRGRRLLLSLRLHDAASRQLIWVSDPIDTVPVDCNELAAAVTETLLEKMAACPAGNHAPELFPWTAITALFSLDDETIKRTVAQIDRSTDRGGLRVLECLGVFAQVFKLHEGVAQPDRIAPDYLSEILSTIPESSPMRPLCESLVGYSAHMLLGENDLAEMLLENAYKRAPQLSLNLDHMAVLKLMRGDLAGAEAAFQQCRRVGTASPWRYTYDVTGAMISMAKGDFRQALFFANQSLMRKPRFIGGLRYAMAGFALSGNTKDAHRMLARIHQLRPDHDLSAWTENMVHRTPAHLGKTLAQSLQSNGLI